MVPSEDEACEIDVSKGIRMLLTMNDAVNDELIDTTAESQDRPFRLCVHIDNVGNEEMAYKVMPTCTVGELAAEVTNSVLSIMVSAFSFMYNRSPQIGGHIEQDGMWVRTTPFDCVHFGGQKLPFDMCWKDTGAAEGAVVIFSSSDSVTSGAWVLDRNIATDFIS